MKTAIAVAALLSLLTIPIASASATGERDSYEPNNDLAHAWPIENATEIESWISSPSDVDWYTFTIGSGGHITITLRSLPYDYDVALGWWNPLTQQVEQIGSSDNSGTQDELIEVDFPYAGQFYILVWAYFSDYSNTDSYLLMATWPAATTVASEPCLIATPSVYPNPSAGDCRIEFDLESAAPVSVGIFDATGRAVRELHSGDLPVGSYSLRWDGRDDDGRDLPAGVYFSHVTTPQGTTTGRIVLTR